MLFVVFLTALCNSIGYWRSDEQWWAGTDDDTEDHREDEAADWLTTQEEDDEQYQQGGYWGHGRTGEGRAQRIVEGVI